MKKHIYKKLHIDCANQLLQQVSSFVLNQSGIVGSSVFWTLTDINVMLNQCPLLWNVTKQVKSNFASAAVVQVDNREYRSVDKIHVDSDKAIILLLPILNCEGTKTIFYDVPESDLYLRPQSDGDDVKYYSTLTDVYPEIDSFELDGPTIMDTGVPHSIYVPETLPLPRISLALRFEQSIEQMLCKTTNMPG